MIPYGHTEGLSPAAHKALERLSRRKVPVDAVTTHELNASLVEATRLSGRQVGVLVHRSGTIDHVIVGTPNQLMLPDIGRLRAGEGRFRGIRLVHTHLHGEPLTKDDLTDLVRLRLDAVCALHLSPAGDVRSYSYAVNVPAEEGGKPYRVTGPIHPSQDKTHFGELIASLEAEFRKRDRLREVRAKDGRAILVHVGDKRRKDAYAEAESSLRELRELARTAGVEVVDAVLQLREQFDPKYVMGKGKLDDVLVRAAELDAETLIFDCNLSPSQASAIAKRTDLKVIDRAQLILDIFAQRAETRDGKLQVELAQLKYALPRLGQKDDSLSRLTGGIGGRGPGETKLEIGKRRAKERIAHLEAQLRTLGKQREQRRRRRERFGVPVVSIVGYTNAGKSTLLNALTGAGVLAEDKLFATLDTRARRLKFPDEREVVLVDTVGFIRNLPPSLFAAFRATFEEAVDADVLLHVVDASDPQKDVAMRTTEKVLIDLEIDAPRILVMNKVDLLDEGARAQLRAAFPEAVQVSALDQNTVTPLIEALATTLCSRWGAARVVSACDAPLAHADDGPGEHLTTLEAMLGKKAKRSHAR